MSNANISRIYNNYLHSLSILLPFESRIETPEQEARFTEVLTELVQTHAQTIPVLAKGFLECNRYISPVEVTKFLDKHLRARIGTRLVAEQHIALHYQAQEPDSAYVGVVDTAMKPAAIIQQSADFVAEICELRYGIRPKLEIDGQVDVQFGFVPVHLEYIATELLKNAFRATVESGKEKEPVVVTVAAAPIDGVDDDARITLRIRDQGGGIGKDVLPDIWTYNFTTFSSHDTPGSDDTGSGSGHTTTMDALNAISNASGHTSTIAGLGYGLPLSRAYAEYFGGGLSVQSLYGWGTDVYLNLRGVPTKE
jgi:signal transduction histidine kinase